MRCTCPLLTQSGHREGQRQSPTAAVVTSMTPSITPNRMGVRIQRRCRVHARRRIDRIFINHHWRRRYNEGRLLDDDRRRSPVAVRANFRLIAWNFAIARHRQIGGHPRSLFACTLFLVCRPLASKRGNPLLGPWMGVQPRRSLAQHTALRFRRHPSVGMLRSMGRDPSKQFALGSLGT